MQWVRKLIGLHGHLRFGPCLTRQLAPASGSQTSPHPDPTRVVLAARMSAAAHANSCDDDRTPEHELAAASAALLAEDGAEFERLVDVAAKRELRKRTGAKRPRPAAGDDYLSSRLVYSDGRLLDAHTAMR